MSSLRVSRAMPIACLYLWSSKHRWNILFTMPSSLSSTGFFSPSGSSAFSTHCLVQWSIHFAGMILNIEEKMSAFYRFTVFAQVGQKDTDQRGKSKPSPPKTFRCLCMLARPTTLTPSCQNTSILLPLKSVNSVEDDNLYRSDTSSSQQLSHF